MSEVPQIDPLEVDEKGASLQINAQLEDEGLVSNEESDNTYTAVRQESTRAYPFLTILRKLPGVESVTLSEQDERLDIEVIIGECIIRYSLRKPNVEDFRGRMLLNDKQDDWLDNYWLQEAKECGYMVADSVVYVNRSDLTKNHDVISTLKEDNVLLLVDVNVDPAPSDDQPVETVAGGYDVAQLKSFIRYHEISEARSDMKVIISTLPIGKMGLYVMGHERSHCVDPQQNNRRRTIDGLNLKTMDGELTEEQVRKISDPVHAQNENDATTQGIVFLREMIGLLGISPDIQREMECAYYGLLDYQEEMEEFWGDREPPTTFIDKDHPYYEKVKAISKLLQ